MCHAGNFCASISSSLSVGYTPVLSLQATVRAMDTITAYMKKKYRIEITNFTLGGISTVSGCDVPELLQFLGFWHLLLCTGTLLHPECQSSQIVSVAPLFFLQSGWITWLTAAVDKRVEAIAPVAMDFLNFTEVRLKVQTCISTLSNISGNRTP